MSFIRFVGAEASAAPFSISLDGVVLVPSLGFKEVTPYLSISSNTHLLTASSSFCGGICTANTFFFEEGRDYTALVARDGNNNITIIIYPDDNSCQCKKKPRLRYINAAVNVLDILADGFVIFRAVPETQTGIPVYINVNSCSFLFSAVLDEPPNVPIVVTPPTLLTFEKKHVYTLISIFDNTADENANTFLLLDSKCRKNR